MRWLKTFGNPRTTLLYLAVTAIVIWPIASQWHREVNKPLAHVDEAAWIFQTHYYDLLFRQHNVHHPDWQDPLVFHHPPIGRYVFGAALAINDLEAHDLENFRWWNANDMDYSDSYWQPFWNELQKRVPPLALATTRTVAAIFALLACAALYALGKEISPGIGAGAALLLAWNPVLRSVTVLGLIETMLLFFLLLSAWAAVQLCRKLSDDAKRPGQEKIAAAVWAITAALAFSVKLNGLLAWLFGVAGLCWLFAVAPDRKSRVECLAFLLGGSALFLGLTILLNPTLWPHPLTNLTRFFTFRAEQMELQRQFGFFNTFPSWHSRVSHFIREIFFNQDFFFAHIRLPIGRILFLAYLRHELGELNIQLPIGLILFLAGILGLSRELPQTWHARRLSPPLWLIGGFLLVGVATLWTFFMNWSRYLLPVMPWVILIQAFGARWVFNALFQPNDTPKRTWWILGGTTLALTAYCFGPLFPPATLYSEAERDFQILINTVKHHPHNKTLRAELAVAYQQLGDTRAAEEQWTEVTKPDPTEEFPPYSETREIFFHKAQARFPNDKRICTQAARYCQYLGQIEKAQELWQKVLQIDPSDPEAQKQLATLRGKK